MKSTMKSLDRVLTVVRGGIPDKVPVGLHNFLMAAKLSGIPMSRVFQDGKLLAETQLQQWRRFKHDMLLIENGTVAMAQALGCRVMYADDHAPYVVEPVIHDWSDIDRLTLPDPNKVFPLTCLVEATRILSTEIGSEVFLQARADQGMLTLASALRGYEQFLIDLADEANYVHINRLTDFCRQAVERLSLALKDAGGHGTCIGETGPATISPRLYRSLVLPNLLKHCKAMRDAEFVSAVHQCGNSLSVIDDLVNTGAYVLELDPSTDQAKAKAAAQGKGTILGMVDPGILLRGSPVDVERQCHQAISLVGPHGGFILAPGCALSENTPVENIEALMAARDKYGVYAADGTLCA
jgi:uroporphyrinogen decarboxylase